MGKSSGVEFYFEVAFFLPWDRCLDIACDIYKKTDNFKEEKIKIV